MTRSLSETLDLAGFAVEPSVLDATEVEHLRDVVANVATTDAVRKRAGTYAIRNLLQVAPEVGAALQSGKVHALAERAMGGAALAVRGILFDKTPDANWLVPWHQDLTICVQERIDVPGFGPWTVKAGVHHVQPPVEFLGRMLAIRIHLDDCNEDNGALRVIPDSHRLGRLTGAQIEDAVAATPAVTCAATAGSALLMRPLLLHASSPARLPSHRRVIHVEFAATELPSGLRWLT